MLLFCSLKFYSYPSVLCSSRLGRCYVTGRLLDTYATRGAPKANEGGPTVRRSETTLSWGSLPLFRRDCVAWLVIYFLSFFHFFFSFPPSFYFSRSVRFSTFISFSSHIHDNFFFSFLLNCDSYLITLSLFLPLSLFFSRFTTVRRIVRSVSN